MHLFQMEQKGASTFLMRGEICFGEIAQSGDQWQAWGYGLDNRIGIFQSQEYAAKAVVDSARRTLEAAGLSLTDDFQKYVDANEALIEARAEIKRLRDAAAIVMSMALVNFESPWSDRVYRTLLDALNPLPSVIPAND